MSHASPCSSAASSRCDVILRCRLVCSTSRNSAAACGYGGPPSSSTKPAVVEHHRLLGKLLEDALEPRQMLGKARHHDAEAERRADLPQLERDRMVEPGRLGVLQRADREQSHAGERGLVRERAHGRRRRGIFRVHDRDAHEPVRVGCGRVDDVRVVVAVRAERLHEHRGVDAGRGQ